MRLLITGGAGFIGSAVIRLCLSETEHEVFNLDSLTYAANLDNLRDEVTSPRYQFGQVDIRNGQAVDAIFQSFKPDAVMHLAAESHVDRSIDAPSDFIETNIVGTYTLLEVARRYWDGLPSEQKSKFRFHHVSTDEVFGSLGDTGFFTETTAYAPNSPYSASKASSDMLARAWHHTFGLPVVTSNCSNNYGPYQFPEKLIPVVILSALEGQEIPVYGQGTNIRDWLHVEDHARALLAVLENGTPGECYAIGGWNELTNIELVRMICRLMDERLPQSNFRPHESLISFVKDRPGHDQRYAIDATKISNELNWRPQFTVEEGMGLTVDWYLQNRWWWKNIQERGFSGSRIGLGSSVQS